MPATTPDVPMERREHRAPMAGPAAICIGAVLRGPLEIVGLKVFSSLQGPAGEVLTICRKTCVAVIATVVDIGNGIGAKPAMLAESAARDPDRPQLGSSMSPPVVGNCSKSCGIDPTAAVPRSRHRAPSGHIAVAKGKEPGRRAAIMPSRRGIAESRSTMRSRFCRFRHRTPPATHRWISWAQK